MLWRYVKCQLMVLLCGGLVGPIFLFTYFGLGQSSLIKWMFYAGLLITAADVLIALALANYGAKSSAKAAALERSGCWRWPRSWASPRPGLASTSSRWSSWTCASPERASSHSTVKTG
ncbi:putative conserved membrane protein [Mycobacterium xenopi 4042]|uniref:Putative conserved membrane protein n=1 Tax=Mycobacterium xenopi 4042 TaxID=1299334 RepID=X7YJH7_MYCXE|nr:putative conserved membrane protein [Mycobacterium xenopi 4042]